MVHGLHLDWTQPRGCGEHYMSVPAEHIARQDRFACDQVGDGTIILALADGAGSASMGGHGAELAVQTVIHVFSSQLQQGRTDLKVV